MNIIRILKRAIDLYSTAPAIRIDGKWYSYQDLTQRISRLAGALTTHGVQRGSRVAALLPNCHQYLELYFGTPLARGILVPLNYRLSAPEISNILNNAQPICVIADSRFSELVQTALKESPELQVVWVSRDGFTPPQGEEYETFLDTAARTIPLEEALTIEEQDEAQIYYTSGTTGTPKGVILTHRNVVFHALMTIAELGLCDRDTWLHAAPMFHLADAWACFALTWVGGKHVMAADFEPDFVLQTIENEGVTITNLIPTMLNMLVNHPNAAQRAYSSLRCILSGGAPISPDLVRQVMQTFHCDYIQTYGLTETSPYLTVSKLKASLDELPDEERFWYKACTGRPLLGIELRVVDHSFNDIPKDRKTVGEIVVRGPSVTPGYFRNPKQTELAFSEGWFMTGDLAVMDEEGYVNIVDRKKDVILSGGEQIFSIEVENTLQEHDAVLEVAVISVPDEKWGEAVKAVVVPHQNSRINEAELIAFCRSRLAHYKAPKSVDFVDSLPKTGSRKINKKAMRDRYWQGYQKRVH